MIAGEYGQWYAIDTEKVFLCADCSETKLGYVCLKREVYHVARVILRPSHPFIIDTRVF